MLLRVAAAACVVLAMGLAASSERAAAQGYPVFRGPPSPYDYVPGDDDGEESVVMIPGARGYPAGPDGYVPPQPGFIYPDQPAGPYGSGRGSSIQRGELPPPGMQAAPGTPAEANAPRPPGTISPGQQSIISSLPPEDQPEVGEPKELPPNLRRQMVEFRTKEPAGTIIIDTANTYLYLTLGHGEAVRYGIGVGREGFTWSGVERISRMAEWPDWHPPEEMIERQPYLPRFMAGGESNPLGARALYLGKTLYRIHGTNQPSTIGTFVSSGCVRLTNEDIQDLFDRVKVGTRVVVLAGKGPPTVQNRQHAVPPATAEAQPPQAIRAR
jgi:lipoprotein-anchoring transpeptidase ErfK/SrfK